MEAKIEHLKLISGAISRMAGNSFLLRGWAVTLVVGIFALSGKKVEGAHYLLAYIPIIAFWFLDGYYLFQERMFRDLYNDVASRDPANVDFSLDTRQYRDGQSVAKAMFSTTPRLLYGALAVVVLIVIITSSV
jgi:hypothetical protein